MDIIVPNKFYIFILDGVVKQCFCFSFLVTEVISAEYRSSYCFTFKFGWVFAYMMLPGIAWLIPNWFWLQFTITVPWLSLLCVFWYVLRRVPLYESGEIRTGRFLRLCIDVYVRTMENLNW